MIPFQRMLRTAWAAATLCLVSTAALAEPGFVVTGRYTAQRKPRVTVLDFEDTNSDARNQRYGSSVQAMLVTFMKRKSQFVVVERQKLGDVLKEWQRNQKGMTNLQPVDPGARELLEKLDAIILGNVTLLDTSAEANVARKTAEGGEKMEVIQGPKIEIDAKLLSRADGRIIAAAQRSGPVACLRSIVERLGIALEQEFLRPYYGKLKVNLSDPESVRIFLTPILLDTALDEEKPPVERSATVLLGSYDHDTIDPWTTDPTTYTIENLLSGWYSMRLERPGYEGLGTENARWEAGEVSGETRVHERETGEPLERAAPEKGRFVVRVDPLATEVIDGDSLHFTFRKKGGSLAPRIKRQYLDEDFVQSPRRVILIGREGLEINQRPQPGEYAEDTTCNLFRNKPMLPPAYGRTYVTSGQSFDFGTFKGGDLIIEDYKGEVVPVGQYEMSLWEPSYEIQTGTVAVHDQDRAKTTHSAMVRNTAPLGLIATGTRTPKHVRLAGAATKHQVDIPLDFDDGTMEAGLPVDQYSVTTDISGLAGWRKEAALLPRSAQPPIFDPKSKEDPPLKSSAEEGGEESKMPILRIKTRLIVAGRLSAFSLPPDPVRDDVYVDRDINEILAALLQPRNDDWEEKTGAGKRALLEVGRAVVSGVAAAIVPRDAPHAAPPMQPPPAAVTLPGSAAVAVASAGKSAEKTPRLTPEPLPRDPEKLRALLAKRLEDVDLLLFDDEDMARLRRAPEVAAIVERYVASGGVLFGFVSEAGDYRSISGAPLTIEAKGRKTNRFELAPGDVRGIEVRRQEKKVKIQGKHELPQLADLDPGWRVVAFTTGRKEPRIVERCDREKGGCTILWCDRPDSFHGWAGGTVPEIEAARTAVERHVLDWSRYLMYRRYDTGGDERRRAEQALMR
jgi:hypothetical protein